MVSHVLVVENYAELLSAICATLERRDFVCDSATSAPEAIQKLELQQYDTVLLSPTLPIRNDPVVTYLREHASDTKIIFMTDPGETEEGHVLVKPFGSRELLEEMG
jgi:DNA-binding response OmpR family regulator